jgi:MFS family permease
VAGRRRYVVILSSPGATPAILFSIVARLPGAMETLVLVSAVAAGTGSFAVAGWAAAAFSAGVAIAGPARGRMADRHGAGLVLAATGSLTAFAWTALYVALSQSGPQLAVAACSFAGGVFLPPVTPIMRTMWSRSAASAEVGVAAVALESVIVNAVYVVGPSLGALSMVVLGVEESLLLVALLSATGCLLLAIVPRVRALTPRHDAVRQWLGPLGIHAVRRMLIVGLFTGAGVNAVEVAILASASAEGHQGSGGLVIAALSVGSIAGGMIYGAHAPAQQDLARLRILLLLVGGGFGLAILAENLYALMAVVAIGGVFFGPMTNELYSALQRSTPSDYLTETFTWQTSASQSGTVATVAVAGALADAGTPGGGFLIAAGSCAIAAALTVAVPKDQASEATRDS